MRIAEHAPALQSSPALQQPATTVHNQLAAAPVAAEAKAAVEAQRQAAQVNQPNRTERGVIRRREGNRSGRRAVRVAARKPRPKTEESSPPEVGPHEPGSGERIDVLA